MLFVCFWAQLSKIYIISRVGKSYVAQWLAIYTQFYLREIGGSSLTVSFSNQSPFLDRARLVVSRA